MASRTLVRTISLFMVFAWTAGCIDTRMQTRKHPLKVETQPPGAQVWLQDESGKLMVGQSPVEIEREYKTETQAFNRWLWAAFAVSVVATGFGGTMAYFGAQPEASGLAPMISGYALAGVGGVGLITSLVYCVMGEQLDGTTHPIAQQLTVGADLVGHQTLSREIEIPGHTSPIAFNLPPLANADKTSGPAREIVAVFDLKDETGKLEPAVVGRLTSYLSTVLVKLGAFRVVPRDQIRSRLLQEKVGTYKVCYDEGCQIALGKAVAAQKTLATTLMPIGDKCTLTANLLDLKTETAEKGASVTSACSEEELLKALDQLAEQLSR